MYFEFNRRQILRTAMAGAATAMVGAGAQTSDKPMRIIVPASAGSGQDVTLRAATNSLSKAFGQSVVVENLAGAGGITGTSVLVRASPDGNTLALVSNNHVVNPSVYQKMPFDPINDITPIAVVGSAPFVLVVNPQKIAAKNAKELQALLKAKPGAYNYASSGNGTIIHLAGAMFMDAADVDVRHIPYRGMAPMVTDIISGQVEMGVVSVPVALQHLKSGALRAVGVMGKRRVPSLAELPTIAEQGFPEVDIAGWFAFIGPAKMPAPEVKRLNAAIVAAFAMPEAKEAMNKQENILHPMSPEASLDFFKNEIQRYAKLVKKADVKIE